MDRWLKTGFCCKRELSVEKPLAIEREDEVGSQASVSAVKTTTDDNVHVSRKTDNQLTKLGSKRCDLSSDSKKLKTDKTGFVDVGSLVAKPLSDAEKYNVLTKSWMPNELYIFPQGTRNLKFQKKWLSEFQWLVYSEEKEGAFCKFCFVFAKDTEVGKGQHVRLGSFVTSPFIRWKDAKEEFRRHEQNNYHQTSCVLAQHFLNVFEGKSDDICSQIDKGKKQKIEENRYKILPVIKTVIFCGRQEIALRGHDDSGRLNLSDLETNKNEGNFKALLKFRIDSGDIALKSHLENCKGNSSYTSPRIQNEIIDACGEIILQKLVQKINDAKCFAILADETTDIVGVEQFTLCARYIVKEEGHFVLKEDFLKFVPVQDTTGAGLSKKILTELGSIGVALSHLKGQGYDGASSMSGKYKGCAALIKEVHPEALYVHCSSHALNLVICHACEVPPVRNSLAIMKDIINFFRSSAKRNALLQEEILTEDPSAKRTRLLKFCETRWSEHLNTLVSFKELYPTIVKVLDRIQNEFDDADTSGKANMLSAAIRNGQFLISLCTATKLFCLTFGLTKYLQMKECDLSQALKYAENVRGEVQAMRENAESEFHRIFLEAQETAEEVGGTISMPRVIRKQTQRDNYETNNAEDYFRLSIFIPLMDFFLQEMEDRFLSHKSVLEKLSLLLPVHIRNVDSSVIESCSKVMSGQWPTVVDDPSMFEAELKMWKRTWIGENDCPTDFLSSLDQCNEGIFPTVHSMLKVSATLPITTATAERSFSTLRRVKTYLRNSTSQTRLNGLAHLSIHRDIAVSPEEVLNTLSKKPRRLDFAL